MRPFIGFPKIARLHREIVVTEKIDGTNAQILITPIDKSYEDAAMLGYWYGEDASTWAMYAGSRTRWITPTDDNFGFAKWAKDNLEELKKMGPGSHFGEWWGRGIQRNYGLKERRFSLFNVHRWSGQEVLPGCCHVVPTLYVGPFLMPEIEHCLTRLGMCGSQAEPGFNNPEGLVVYHTASKQLFKKTIEKDESPKGIAE